MASSSFVRGIAIKSRSGGPMLVRPRITLNKDIGLDGIITAKGYRQVTLISIEKWNDVQRELGTALTWLKRRANFLTDGEGLQSLVGRTVRIGTAIVSILDELEPCSRIDREYPGLAKALLTDFRGGVFGRIEENGIVELGSSIESVVYSSHLAEGDPYEYSGIR